MRDDPPPRFVPILTEVVQAPAAVAPMPTGAPGTAPVPASPEPALHVDDEWVGRLTARVLAELEPLVVDAVRTLQAQQARDVQALVRALVADRLAQLVADIQVVTPPE